MLPVIRSIQPNKIVCGKVNKVDFQNAMTVFRLTIPVPQFISLSDFVHNKGTHFT